MASLDPDLALLLPELDALVASSAASAVSATELRAASAELIAHLHVAQAQPFAGAIHDQQVEANAGPPVHVRVYEPHDAADDVAVLFHGGGWVVGDCDSADATARALAQQLASTVVSVDYRLAPEHPFPAGLDDCLAVVAWVAAERRPAWLGVAGDSAGGNLAAAVSLVAPRNRLHIDAQLLIYPALDSAMSTASYRTFATGYGLTADVMRYYWDSYGASAAPTNPMLSPSHAADLSDLPPTVLTSAGFDPLGDEAERFAARLVGSGVPTTYLPAPTLAHGWLDMGDRVPAARLARTEAFAAFDLLRRHMRRQHNPETFRPLTATPT